jgi:hypothetical protein
MNDKSTITGSQTGFDIRIFIDIISRVISVEIKAADLKIGNQCNQDQKQTDPRLAGKL